MIRPKVLKHSNKAWAVNTANWQGFLLSALGLVLLSGFMIGTAQASEKSKQRLIYDVYAGGFHAVRANVDIDMSKKGRYTLFMGAHTRGFLGSLAPWEGTFESHGWVVGDGEFKPELHKSVTTWRDESEIKEYNYTIDGGFKNIVITEHDKPPETPEIAAELTEGTTDALTAALYVFDAVSKGQECTGEKEVFDGKRRFQQTFKQKREVELTSTKYNVYEGPAVECIVEVKPVSGKWHEKPRGWMSIQEQGREKGTMPTVWLANMAEGEPAVPVKIRVKTDYGTLFMHLVEYYQGKDVLLAEKRADLSEDE